MGDGTPPAFDLRSKIVANHCFYFQKIKDTSFCTPYHQMKDAQQNPEKYGGMQIRVCGWNVRFTEMDKSEQDMYIRRAENISE